MPANLRAIVQGRFPFLGKMRSPGEELTPEELAQTTPAVRDALVSQKLIVLDGALDVSRESEPVQHLAARVDALAEKIDKLIAAFSSGGEVFQGQIDVLAADVEALKGAPPADGAKVVRKTAAGAKSARE